MNAAILYQNQACLSSLFTRILCEDRGKQQAVRRLTVGTALPPNPNAVLRILWKP